MCDIHCFLRRICYHLLLIFSFSVYIYLCYNIPGVVKYWLASVITGFVYVIIGSDFIILELIEVLLLGLPVLRLIYFDVGEKFSVLNKDYV